MNGRVLIEEIVAKTFKVEQGRVSITAETHLVGEDLCVILYGGTKPHIGSITLSIPRPSLKDKNVISATTSMLNITGHKDDEAARYVSNALASALNRNVVVTCGIHVDAITEEEIKVTFKLLQSLLDLLVKSRF